MRTLAAVLLLATLALASCSEPPNSQRALAAARVTQLGGWVRFGPETTVYLANTSASDADLDVLVEFEDLTEIDLSHTQITDAGLRRLDELADLRRVVVTGCDVTEGELAALLRRRTRLSVVR